MKRFRKFLPSYKWNSFKYRSSWNIFNILSFINFVAEYIQLLSHMSTNQNWKFCGLLNTDKFMCKRGSATITSVLY